MRSQSALYVCAPAQNTNLVKEGACAGFLEEMSTAEWRRVIGFRERDPGSFDLNQIRQYQRLPCGSVESCRDEEKVKRAVGCTRSDERLGRHTEEGRSFTSTFRLGVKHEPVSSAPVLSFDRRACTVADVC